MNSNQSHIKELISTTTIYGLSIFLNRSAGFLLLPLYTYYLSPQEMGLFNLMQSIWLFIILIYMYGMETSFIKFFIEADSEEEKKTIYSSTIILITITSLLLSVLFFITGGDLMHFFRFEDQNMAVKLFRLICILLFIDTLSRFPLLLLRAKLKAKSYLFINTFGLILNILLNIVLLVYFNLKVEAIFISYIISLILSFILGLILTRDYLAISFNWVKVKILIKYGNKFIYIGLFLLLIDVSDRFFLKYLCDESVVGIYSASYKLASIMSLIIAAFRFSWTPYFLNISKNPENKTILSNIFTYFTFVGLFLFLLFSFFIPDIVKANLFGISILELKYQPGLVIIPAVLLSYFFSGIFANLNVAPFFRDKTSYILLVSFIGLVTNFILNFILIPNYNMLGAAYATLASYLIMSIIIFLISQKIYKIDFQYKKIIIIFFVTFLVFFSKILAEKYFLFQNKYMILL